MRNDLDVGAALRMLRESRGWTQEEMARRLGTTRQHVSLIERPGHNAQVDTIDRALSALESDWIELGMLLEGHVKLVTFGHVTAGVGASSLRYGTHVELVNERGRPMAQDNNLKDLVTRCRSNGILMALVLRPGGMS